MKNRIFIEGKSVNLRILAKEDVSKNYIHWFDDSEVCKFNSHHRFPYSEENLIKYIENLYNSNNNLVLAIIEKNTNIHIGNISLQNINFINRSAEFAIIIGEKDYWGKGIAKECGKLILEHGFNSLNLNRIYCGTSSNNIGMQQLAVFLGFSEEGRRRKAEFKNGEYADVVEYGLLKDEWNSKFDYNVKNN